MRGMRPRETLTLEQREDAYIRRILLLARGNKSAAARMLGISRATLHRRLVRMAEVQR